MLTHMFWAYGGFSRMEYMCAKSFIKNGYDLNIWTYGDCENFIDGAQTKNAREIIDEKHVFLNSKGSYAGFSDLFRYMVLDQIGELYVDTDVFAIKHSRELPLKKFLVTERIRNGGYKINGNVIYNPDPQNGNIINLAKNYSKNFRGEDIQWGEIGPELLTFIVNSYSLHGFEIFPPDFANPINWWECPSELLSSSGINRLTDDTYFVHFYNEMWRRNSYDKNKINSMSTLYEILIKSLE